MALYASWVHGNAAIPERTGGTLGQVDGVPWSDIVGLRQGFGATYSVPASGCWFHFPIPTPVIVSDTRAKLLKVFLLWETLELVGLAGINQQPPALGPKAINVWDGRNLVYELYLQVPLRSGPGFRPRADGSDWLIEGTNMFSIPNSPDIYWGVGLSVLIAAQNYPGGRVQFISAGADFIV